MITEKTRRQGTPIVWMAAGGDYAITLGNGTGANGVASTEARSGVVGDLALNTPSGKRGSFARRWAVEMQIEMDVAPVAGTTVELWWAPSKDGIILPGGAVTGTDADWQTGTEAEFKVQLMHIGSVILTADVQPVVQIGNFVFEPPYRYGCPVVVNLGGQELEGNDDVMRITFTPEFDEDS